MKINNILLVIFTFTFLPVYSQNDSTIIYSQDSILNISQSSTPAVKTEIEINTSESVYTLKPGVDIPIVAVGTVWSVYAFTKIYNKTHPTIDQIQNLKKEDINAFDRWAVYRYSQSLDDISYYPFYASIPLPLVFFLTGKETRNDFLKLGFLYWEAMSITGLLGTSATYHIDLGPMHTRQKHLWKNEQAV